MAYNRHTIISILNYIICIQMCAHDIEARLYHVSLSVIMNFELSMFFVVKVFTWLQSISRRISPFPSVISVFFCGLWFSYIPDNSIDTFFPLNQTSCSYRTSIINKVNNNNGEEKLAQTCRNWDSGEDISPGAAIGNKLEST